LALRSYKQESADFADSYIAYSNCRFGCDHTVTFDKKAAKLNRVKLLV
jgi:predicted nucleic-acid-binding protein